MQQFVEEYETRLPAWLFRKVRRKRCIAVVFIPAGVIVSGLLHLENYPARPSILVSSENGFSGGHYFRRWVLVADCDLVPVVQDFCVPFDSQTLDLMGEFSWMPDTTQGSHHSRSQPWPLKRRGVSGLRASR